MTTGLFHKDQASKRGRLVICMGVDAASGSIHMGVPVLIFKKYKHVTL